MHSLLPENKMMFHSLTSPWSLFLPDGVLFFRSTDWKTNTVWMVVPYCEFLKRQCTFGLHPVRVFRFWLVMVSLCRQLWKPCLLVLWSHWLL